jgi:hypothetical protein
LVQNNHTVKRLAHKALSVNAVYTRITYESTEFAQLEEGLGPKINAGAR